LSSCEADIIAARLLPLWFKRLRL